MLNRNELDMLQWFQTLPSETLQTYNTEINRILLARYKDEADKSKEHLVDLSVALCMLGERQSKENITLILDKLEQRNKSMFSFDKLINKLKGKMK